MRSRAVARRRRGDRAGGGDFPVANELAATGWVLPPTLVSGAASTPVLVGTLDGGVVGSVDERGLVDVGGRWSLDWWIGADDRWHLPAREAAVRQHLVEAAPVVETAMRIPGGDAVHRAYGVKGPAVAGVDFVMVEVRNASSVPFALALVVRPLTSATVGGVSAITLEHDQAGGPRATATVFVDGAPAVVFPRGPARAAGGTRRDGDVLGPVTSGAATEHFAAVSDPDGLACAAFVFPVPHTATVRVALPLGAASGDAAPRYPGDAPDGDRVARGWAAQSAGGARTDVPYTRVNDGVHAVQRTLLLRASAPSAGLAEAALLVSALGREGFKDQAAQVLATWPERLTGAVATGDALAGLDAVVGHWARFRDRSLIESLLPEVVTLVRVVERAIDGGDDRIDLPSQAEARPVLLGLADLLGSLGQRRAAERVSIRVASLPDRRSSSPEARPAAEPNDGTRRRSSQPSRTLLLAEDPSGSAGSSHRWDALASSLDVGPTWAWPRSEAFSAAVRSLLVDDTTPGRLNLLPDGPGRWYGQGIELHDAPTAAGCLSFAVRWHGDRPALLWQLDAHRDRPDVVIASAGLDPVWSTTEPRGEALLAPLAPPVGLDPVPSGERAPDGLGRAEAVAPRSVLPMAPRPDVVDGRADDAPDEPGRSFT